MLGRFLATSALLLTTQLAATTVASITGLPAISEASAADFTGRIKRIKIRKRRVSSFRISTVIIDDGDATAADVAKLEIAVCQDAVCGDTDTWTSFTPEAYTGRFRSARLEYAGGVSPEGSYQLTTNLLNADGKEIGAIQSWTLSAEGEEIIVEPNGDVDYPTYVSDLTVQADECGTGKLVATVSGDDASQVSQVQFIDDTGSLFEEPAECNLGQCQTGTLRKGKSTYTDTEVDLGELGVKLAELEEAKVFVSVVAYGSDGKELGRTHVEAVAKYGDILIDGVPLEFD